jgi:hypothetical protein
VANSSVAVTAGAGTAIDTRTDPDGNHRQVVVIGDPDAANVAAVSAAGALEVEQSINLGRTRVSIVFSGAPATTDTMVTSTIIRAGVAGASAVSHAVTAGKKLRITAVQVALRTTTAATPFGLLALRSNPSGATAVGSPVVLYAGLGGTAAVIGNTAMNNLSIEEGIEFSGTETIGFSALAGLTTNVLSVAVIGYEY